jgi:hypothetical protein
LVSDQPQNLFNFFRDNFQLPEVWPFYQHETFASGGLSLSNVVLEFVSLPKEDPDPLKTEFRGVALEPTMDAIATSAELSERHLSHTEIMSYKSQVPGSKVVAEWSSIGLSKLPPENADIFFCDYKDRERVEKGRKEAGSELARQGGGPLGIIDAAEIIVGVRDIKEARRKWSALLSPSPRISNDAFFFNTGPAIRLVHTKSPGIKGIILRVNSLDYAVKFLDDHGWLSRDKKGQITVSPDVIEGLSIILVEASVGDKENSSVLGSGRGVGYMGILVKDLDTTRADSWGVWMELFQH